MKDKTLDNVEDLVNNRPPSPGHGEFNLIDTNQLINKYYSLIDKFHNLDIDSQLIILSIILVIFGIIYIIYIFSYIISPSIFDAIKDILPIKIKNFMIKFINVNRKLSIPFVILSFIMVIICLLVAILALSVIIYFNNLK
jgi:hypothetical protein